MGATASVASVRKQHFKEWNMDMVNEVYRTWQKDYDSRFSLSREELGALTSACPTVVENIDTEQFSTTTWEVMAGDAPSLDACGMIAALAVMSDGPVEDKVHVVFSVFDFNRAGAMTQDELTILFLATNASLARYAGQKLTPSKSAKRCEALAVAAFKESSNGTQLTEAEFCGFVSRFMKMFKQKGKRHLQTGGMSEKEREQYDAAAVMIQSIARGKIDRHRMAMASGAATRIQALLRGKVARKRQARRRSVLMNAATGAFTTENGAEGEYTPKGVRELVEASAKTATEGNQAEKTEEQVKLHAQRLALVRHALRTLRDDELASITEVATPDIPMLVLAGALCVVFKAAPTWVSADEILKDPSFRNRAVALTSDKVPPKALPIVTKLFTDHTMLQRLASIGNRPAKIIMNWLALLVGMDLPTHLQVQLRNMAKTNAQAGATDEAKSGAGESKSRGAGAGSAGAGAGASEPPPDTNAAALAAARKRQAERQANTMVAAVSGGRMVKTLMCLNKDRGALSFSRTGTVAIVTADAGRCVHLQGSRKLRRAAGQSVAYFEVRVLDPGAKRSMACGLAPKGHHDDRLVGWGAGSLGYHADSGKKLSGVGSLGTVEQAFGPTWKAGDVVGCGLNWERRQVFFTVNGSLVGIAARSVSVTDDYWPTISLGEQGQAVSVNFGDKPFVYDKDSEAMTRGKGGSRSRKSSGGVDSGSNPATSVRTRKSRGPASGSSARVRRLAGGTADKRFANGPPGSSGGSVYLSVGGPKRTTMVSMG